MWSNFLANLTNFLPGVIKTTRYYYFDITRSCSNECFLLLNRRFWIFCVLLGHPPPTSLNAFFKLKSSSTYNAKRSNSRWKVKRGVHQSWRRTCVISLSCHLISHHRFPSYFVAKQDERCVRDVHNMLSSAFSSVLPFTFQTVTCRLGLQSLFSSYSRRFAGLFSWE